MVYNPIFEEEMNKDKDFLDLKKAIKMRAGKDQVKDLCTKFTALVKNHPVITTVALGVFASSLVGSKK